MEDLLVPHEVRPLPEGLLTVRASVRSLSRVDTLVGDEVRAPGEAFPARGAEKGLFLGVCPPVTQEDHALREALPAIQALEGLLSRVDPSVPGQAASPGEDLLAVHALVYLPSGATPWLGGIFLEVFSICPFERAFSGSSWYLATFLIIWLMLNIMGHVYLGVLGLLSGSFQCHPVLFHRLGLLLHLTICPITCWETKVGSVDMS